MARLVLIKHSLPVLDPDVPSPRWVLSEAGRARCNWLAGELRSRGVSRLFSSLEPKALETAALMGTQLGLAIEPRVDLHENDRAGLGFPSEDVLRRIIADFFARPDDVVMGTETANAAQERFSRAVQAILKQGDDENIAIIAHGTVLTLFVAQHNAIDPVAFWGGLATPSYVEFDSQSLTLAGPPVTFPKV